MSCAAGVGALPRRPWYGQLASVGDGPAPLLVGLLSFVLDTKLVLVWSAGAVCSGAAAAASSAVLYTSVLETLLEPLLQPLLLLKVLAPPVAGAATSAAAAGAGAAAAESGRRDMS